jgi:ribosomal protein S6--L-glutamate ligase
MLYRPAVSFVAQRLEQQLYAPGVATFYRDGDEIHFGCHNPAAVFQRHGLSIPRTIFCQTSDRTLLSKYAERLGGFPLVFKIPGFSTGIGVGRLDSAASLFSFVDLSLALGRFPLLMAYVPDAVHWRLVVVGDRVVGAYRNIIIEDDFRSAATRDEADYTTPPSDRVRQLAVRATHALRLEFSGVDVLEHASGRPYLLEANFPCYFAQAQDVAGVDISGAMLDHLIEKAQRLEGA